MFELTIKGNTYQFNFGMGFLREVNKKMKAPVDGVPNAEKSVGCRMLIIDVFDGEPEALVDVLLAANKNQDPRVTRETLDAYIDDPDTDMDKLFGDVLDFLEQNNATRKIVKNIKEAAAAQGINL